MTPPIDPTLHTSDFLTGKNARGAADGVGKTRYYVCIRLIKESELIAENAALANEGLNYYQGINGEWNNSIEGFANTTATRVKIEVLRGTATRQPTEDADHLWTSYMGGFASENSAWSNYAACSDISGVSGHTGAVSGASGVSGVLSGTSSDILIQGGNILECGWNSCHDYSKIACLFLTAASGDFDGNIVMYYPGSAGDSATGKDCMAATFIRTRAGFAE